MPMLQSDKNTILPKINILLTDGHSIIQTIQNDNHYSELGLFH